MSGIEAVGLAVGVVPILVTAAAAYRKLNDCLRTLRHRHRIASRLWLQFRCIQARLRDSFRHFLAPVLQENDPWQLMQEATLTAEQQVNIAAHIHQSLGIDSAAIFTEVFEEITKILDEVKRSLVIVETLATEGTAEAQRSKKSSKEALDITLHESVYKKRLDELRTWVGELCHLLSANGNSRKQDHDTKSKQALPLPSSVTAINEASRQLGIDLEKAWTCLDTTHSSHNAALWFNAQLDLNDVVHMDVAISCRLRTPPKSSLSSQELQTISPALTESGAQPQKRVKLSTAMSSNTARTGSLTTHNGDQVGRSRLANSQNSSTTTVRPISQSLALGPKHSLDGLPSMCCHLCAVNFSRLLNNFKCCRGYIGTARGYLGTAAGYQHAIFDHSGPTCASDEISLNVARDSHSVTYYLSQMTVVQQLKTGYEVTMGLLKYSLTPWLPEEWSLNDVSCLGSSFDHSTLHVTKRLPNNKRHGLLTAETIITPSQELQTLLGVRNKPLANLGHALLELAHRKPLKDLRQPGDPHNAVAPRRLVNGVDTIFGVRYRHMVRKCLEADFVVDCTDLSDARLRPAVYNNVALELDRLVKDFERIMSLA
ncbi:uncharacterized protein EI97DRAFT_498022 [Westerdykella ornata]|uniref:Uncharacterized protein n=1 Tax=Westerdykella ornata TaxID=318751 RepID=A0A6A6K218_WESOR|nr:uncharacterized protein EI97DRAFT_498022 [Westerdykella ornata]KAF2281429.1 hypothetical protein EI97DRAFT_498022 [Westerdykella ornata]